ncbi:Sfum_1244 family protein [Thiohalophilus sp.]|uniref:Sfum_1244 family protein n=1 Tax=Thiohalophilus sp. TaxID=3028392 RepID=UPI002ACD27EE|nr:Sfum_1244 family protein [Thiohalophilus sp.]MDZ7804472.1 hypothetical protein [Thiohalophilus sp.]
MSREMQQLQETVQRNCHIADASHAGDYTLCIYLMKMREFFRWEAGETYSASLDNKQVGSWLREREALWDSLQTEHFNPMQIGDAQYDPFESGPINEELRDTGLVYSGGLGVNNKPHFFLARLERRDQYNGYSLYVADKELARDLTSPPAMAQGNNIYIRRESLKRMLWEKLESWNWNQPDNAMGKALAYYDFKSDVDRALEAMTDNELETILLHEIGEIRAGERLGQKWEELLITLPYTRAELMLRAVRDHLADAISTLPALLEKENEPSLHFYFGNLTHMRKHLSPSLMDAYRHWQETDNRGRLEELADRNEAHWSQLTDEILKIEPDPERQYVTAIQDLIENNRL